MIPENLEICSFILFVIFVLESVIVYLGLSSAAKIVIGLHF